MGKGVNFQRELTIAKEIASEHSDILRERLSQTSIEDIAKFLWLIAASMKSWQER